MATREQAIKVTRPAPASKDECRSKAEFDSNMRMITFHCDWADTPEAAEYFLRRLMVQAKSLSKRFGLKITPE